MAATPDYELECKTAQDDLLRRMWNVQYAAGSLKDREANFMREAVLILADHIEKANHIRISSGNAKFVADVIRETVGCQK